MDGKTGLGGGGSYDETETRSEEDERWMETDKLSGQDDGGANEEMDTISLSEDIASTGRRTRSQLKAEGVGSGPERLKEVTEIRSEEELLSNGGQIGERGRSGGGSGGGRGRG